MKTVTGRVISEEPISLSHAATILSGFVSSKNSASQDVSAYLRRAYAAFTELKSIHSEIKSSSLKETEPRCNARQERNPTGEFDELGQPNKRIADLEVTGGKIGLRKSKTVSVEESVYGKEQDEIKEGKKKKKSKKKTEEDVVEEKVKENLEEELRKDKKKTKKRKNDGEMGSEERKSKRKRELKEIGG